MSVSWLSIKFHFLNEFTNKELVYQSGNAPDLTEKLIVNTCRKRLKQLYVNCAGIDCDSLWYKNIKEISGIISFKIHVCLLSFNLSVKL